MHCLLLMTGYYGAFSTTISKFLGQIQSTNIDTSYKSILTRLSNNEKIEKNYLSKMLTHLCSPPPPLPTPLMGLSHGEQLAESLQSPTLTGPPVRGSSRALLLQFLYI